MPELDTKVNGLQCPACYASFPDSCKDDTVDCVGSESQCIDLAGYIHFGNSFSILHGFLWGLILGCILENHLNKMYTGWRTLYKAWKIGK